MNKCTCKWRLKPLPDSTYQLDIGQPDMYSESPNLKAIVERLNEITEWINGKNCTESYTLSNNTSGATAKKL